MDLIIYGFIRALFRGTGKQAQNLKDFTKMRQHLTYKKKKKKITNGTYWGISTCMGRLHIHTHNRTIPSWNDMAVSLGKLMTHIRNDLWFLLQNSKSPKCKSIHYTRRSWWALAGNKIGIRGRWERLAMKKVPWRNKADLVKERNKTLQVNIKYQQRQNTRTLKLCSFSSM